MALEFLPGDIDFDENDFDGDDLDDGERDIPGDATFPKPPKDDDTGEDIPGITDVPTNDIAQFEVPDWLKELSEEGIDERSRFLRQGTRIGEQSAIQQRQVGEMGFLSGASSSGFAGEAQRQIDLAGKKSLVDLDLAVRSEDEKAKRDALGQIQAIEFQNRRIRDQEKNTARAEKLAQEQRDWMERLARAMSGTSDVETSMFDILNAKKGG